MYWIWQFIVSHRNITSIIVAVALSLFMMGAGRQEQQTIVKTLLLTIFSPAQLVVGSFYQLDNIFSENRLLREKIVLTELENAALREKLDAIALIDSSENLVEITEKYGIISANVVAREPTFFYRTAIINAGANRGVRNYMPVVSDGGVVGKIISVMPLTSQVKMIYAPDNNISIEHRESGSVGILESKTDGRLFSDFRSVAPVEVGDEIFTTGLGGIYPRGLKIGVIEEVEAPRTGDIFKRIHIRSAIDFERLRRVFVVKFDSHWGGIQQEIIARDGE